MLRSARRRAQRAESVLRGALPEAAGGRFAAGSLRCRPLVEADRPALAALRPERGAQQPHASISFSSLQGPRLVGTAIEWRGALIGWGFSVGVGPAEAAPFEHVLLSADYVAPRFRRRGAAQALHAARLADARARGARAVLAWVHEDNHAARAALRASGFAPASRGDEPAWLEPPGPRHVLHHVLVRPAPPR